MDLEVSIFGVWKYFFVNVKLLEFVLGIVTGYGFMIYEYCGNLNWEIKVEICLGIGKVCKVRVKGN